MDAHCASARTDRPIELRSGVREPSTTARYCIVEAVVPTACGFAGGWHSRPATRSVQLPFPNRRNAEHRSRFPLKEWCRAAYFVATHTPGRALPNCGARVISYKTAWFCFSAFAGEVNAAQSPSRSRGADEVFIGVSCPQRLRSGAHNIVCLSLEPSQFSSVPITMAIT